jgi:hypothetical protein
MKGEDYKIYSDRSESPSIKYLFEYGALRASQSYFSYPDNFDFQKAIQHNFYDGKKSLDEWYNSQPTMNDLMMYDVLVTPELFKMKPREFSNKWKLLKGSEKIFVKVENGKK